MIATRICGSPFPNQFWQYTLTIQIFFKAAENRGQESLRRRNDYWWNLLRSVRILAGKHEGLLWTILTLLKSNLFFFCAMQFFGPGWKFVATAVFIRICHATGNAMVIVSTFSYSAVEFQECVGTIFVSTKTYFSY